MVSAMSAGGVDQSALAGCVGGGARPELSELIAGNPNAFGIIQSLLAECTPPVEAVCLQVLACGARACSCVLGVLACSCVLGVFACQHSSFYCCALLQHVPRCVLIRSSERVLRPPNVGCSGPRGVFKACMRVHALACSCMFLLALSCMVLSILACLRCLRALHAVMCMHSCMLACLHACLLACLLACLHACIACVLGMLACFHMLAYVCVLPCLHLLARLRCREKLAVSPPRGACSMQTTVRSAVNKDAPGRGQHTSCTFYTIEQLKTIHQFWWNKFVACAISIRC